MSQFLQTKRIRKIFNTLKKKYKPYDTAITTRIPSRYTTYGGYYLIFHEDYKSLRQIKARFDFEDVSVKHKFINEVEVMLSLSGYDMANFDPYHYTMTTGFELTLMGKL